MEMLVALSEGADVAAHGQQEVGDINLLKQLLTVIHGCKQVLGADAVCLLKALEQSCRSNTVLEHPAARMQSHGSQATATYRLSPSPSTDLQ